MANEQDKSGQQGGTSQNAQGSRANDPGRTSEAGQKGGQTTGGRPEERQQGGQGSWEDKQRGDLERASGANQQGAKGGHGADTQSDNRRPQDMEDNSQTVQDEDSGMTDDNR